MNFKITHHTNQAGEENVQKILFSFAYFSFFSKKKSKWRYLKMFKKKELSAAQIEAVETKNYFDRIVPGMIKFYTDHYICGNFYKSCWAITEYPPNTEEPPF